jgi:hypothetical protein
MRTRGERPESLEDVLHDLRTPLTVVKGSISTVLRHWASLDEDRRRELLVRASEAVEELAAVVEQMEAGTRAAWELEHTLADEAGIAAARVDADLSGITSVRVLVDSSHDPETARTQVMQVARARLGWDVDPSRIDVVRPPMAATLGDRKRLSSVITERLGDKFMTRVTIERGDDTLVGESHVGASRRQERYSAVQATLDALREVFADDVAIAELEVIEIGTDRVAVVALNTRHGPLLGSALVRLDDHDALSRATLDALNRVLDRPREVQPAA